MQSNMVSKNFRKYYIIYIFWCIWNALNVSIKCLGKLDTNIILIKNTWNKKLANKIIIWDLMDVNIIADEQT